MISQFLKDLNVKGKRVFLRADLNVPLKDKKILQDYRLTQILPTIKYIQQNGGKVVLATHLGRPKAASETNFFDPNLSTDIIAYWLREHGFKTTLQPDLLLAKQDSTQDFDTILLLENLRFFNGEKGNEQEREKLTELLKDLADVYVNDAFGLIHRDDASVSLLPAMFNKKEKAIGFLIEKEITELNKLKESPAHPYLLVLGGSKIKDKIKLLQNFLDQPKTNRIDSIIVGGAIANTFLKAKGFDVGKSFVQTEYLDFAKEFLNHAEKQNISVFLPVDHLAIQNVDIKKLLSDKGMNLIKNYYENENIPSDGICVDIGPKTIKLFEQEILKAKTIFVNGTMGIYQHLDLAQGTEQILNAIANSNAYIVAGGGDCTAAAFMFGLENKFNFLSTGGGATLAFLANTNVEKELPALQSLC